MISFKDYLSGRVDFISDTNNRILREGLIVSYPIDVFRKHLKDFEGFKSMGPIFDGSSFKVMFNFNNKSEVQFIEWLNREMFLYGYNVGKISEIYKTSIIVTIEQKYPAKLEPELVMEYPWYHITNSQYVDKILKYGLGPRSSTTEFTHAGSRIYILQPLTENISSIRQLMKALYNSKLAKLKQDGKLDRASLWADSKMIILKITLTPDIEVRHDPFTPDSNEYRAGIVSQYIKPENIGISDIE